MAMLRVLHVDDDADIRAVVEMALRLDSGIVTRSCGSGAEALTAAVDWRPDIIVLDVMMPGMDGPATLAHLRDNPVTSQIPVAFMTARAQSHELERFGALGAAGIISKPFDPITLGASVRSYVYPPPQDAGVESLRRAVFLRRDDADMVSAHRAARQNGKSIQG